MPRGYSNVTGLPFQPPKMFGNKFSLGKHWTLTKEQREHYRNPKSEEHRKRIAEAQRGINGNNWQGGKTSIQKSIRNSPRYKEWRKSVFERDNYICQFCGLRGGRLNADHYPIRFSDMLDMYEITSLEESLKEKRLWDKYIARTLCKKCHEPTYQGRRKKFFLNLVK